MLASLAIDIRDILPSQETLEDMARRRYQKPNVLKTDGKRPQWYVRYMVDVITGPGEMDRREMTKYLGLCKEVGKRDAEKLRDAILSTVNRPDVVIPSQVPFSYVLGVYRESFIPALKPNSQSQYLSAISAHIADHFGDMRLCDIRRETVQAWILKKRDLSPARRRLLLSVLASIWERASEWDYTSSRNPAIGIMVADDGGGKRRDTRSLTWDEIRRLLAAVDMRPWCKDLAQMIRIAIFCGLRIGELQALRWSDIQPGMIRVRKSRSQRGEREITDPKSRKGKRDIPLPEWVALERPVGATDDDLLFPGAYSTYEQRLDKVGKAAGLAWYGFGWHTMRHTYATIMDEAGERNLSRTMGHETEKMSQHYVTRSAGETAGRQRWIAEQLIGKRDSGRELFGKNEQKPQ